MNLIDQNRSVAGPPTGSASADPDTPPPPSPGTGSHSRDRATAAVTTRLLGCLDLSEEQELRRQLVLLNTPVARRLASRYRYRGESDEDLDQVAFLGLIEAAHRFDPRAERPFHAFFVPTVLGSLRRHFRDRGWVIRPPRSLQELQVEVFRAQAELEEELTEAPGIADIAHRLGSSVEAVGRALTLTSCYHPVPLDRAVCTDEDGPSTLGELLVSKDRYLAEVEARLMLRPAMRRLSPREQYILRLRYVEDCSQSEIAALIGVSQMQVSRLLRNIHKKLRTAVEPAAAS